MDATMLVILTLVLGAAIIAFFLLSSRGGSGPATVKGEAILFVGEMGAGKTAIWHRLRYNRFVSTVTSMAPNIDSFVPEGLAGVSAAKNWTYVDIPGHGSFRSMYSSYLPKSRAIVFVVDSRNDFIWQQAAQHLYSILSDSSVSGRIPIIIACNKTEPVAATSTQTVLSPAKIRSSLETEIEKMRKVRESTREMEVLSDDSGAAGPKTVRIGKKGVPFKFDEYASPVEFVSVSAETGNLKELEDALVQS